MTVLSLIRAGLEAVTAYYRAAVIRERRALRAELKQLDHEILQAATAGDAERISLLQNRHSDAAADLEALRAASLPAAAAGASDPRG